MSDSRGLIDTPIGPVGLDGEDSIAALNWGRAGTLRDGPVFDAASDQISEYFCGQRQSFDLPLAPAATPFQEAFRAALCAIPYGHTRTYGEIAADLGISAQAAGQACGANPIAIIVPCHRILGASGLGGFSGGIGVETKVALLRLEGAAGLLI